jgi:nucleoside-diphosphate-sugar epimerase
MNLDGARMFMTGGTDFIGSHFVPDLHAAGARVTVHDISSGRAENPQGVEAPLEVIRGDVLD